MKRYRTDAVGSWLPTGWLLNDDSIMLDYQRNGYISRVTDEEPTSKVMQINSGTGLRIVFPTEMGDTWHECTTTTESHRYQTYGSPYGLITAEFSRESILLLLLEQEELQSVYGILENAGWEPEIVGERSFIRCPRKKVRIISYG